MFGLNKNEGINIVENVIERLVKEGIMDIEDSDDNHFIDDNNSIILRLIDDMCEGLSQYTGCDMDDYEAFAEFSDLIVVVSVDDDGYIYVSRIDGSVTGGKNASAEVWNDVCSFIGKINSFDKKLDELQISGSNPTVESIKRVNEAEEFKNNQNYTHFAVNKDTGKIVNGWDYSDYDSDELKAFKKDYFFADLIDYDLDPKQYKILSDATLRKRGIDPDDNSNWAQN